MFNNELLRICKEHQAECFDLASKIPHGYECLYGPYHFTEKGSELTADEIAEYMMYRGK